MLNKYLNGRMFTKFSHRNEVSQQLYHIRVLDCGYTHFTDETRV